jgi:tRNA modification GTPase
VRLRTLVEATLDFPEEEIDFLQQADAHGQLEAIGAALDGVLTQARQGALLRDGMQIVLAGQPNVGKSSLLNALAGAELAIVTPIPGTTRDKVSQAIQIEGVPLHIVDTAGLRELGASGDDVERIGIARSWQAITDADAVVLLHDLTRAGEPGYEAANDAIVTRLREHGVARVLNVHNKADAAPVPIGALAVSARTGAGLDALRRALLEQVGWQGAAAEGVFIARARHLQALEQARDHLRRAHQQLAARALDLLAEDLRLAHNSLGEITGAWGAEELLGEIFARFCIGK